MKTQFSMQKLKQFAVQFTWELIGSIFITARYLQFCCTGKISDDGIFRYFHYLIPTAECTNRTFNHYTEYPAGYYLLSAPWKEILCQLFAVHGSFFFDH